MRLILTGLTGVLFTMAAFGQTEATFRKTYDALVAGLKAKNFQAVMDQRSVASRKELAESVPPSQRAAFFASALEVMPSTYEVRSVTLSEDGKKGSMVLVGMVPVPLEVQKEEKLPPEQKIGVTLEFANEAGVWKIGEIVFGGDPGDRARPKDLNMGQRGDYGDAANTQVGGPILRIEKQAAGVVYVIRVVDEEDAVFVPAAQVSPDFVTGAVMSFRAAKHEKDPLKYWAESAELNK